MKKDKERMETLLNLVFGTITMDEANETLKIETLKYEPELELK